MTKRMLSAALAAGILAAGLSVASEAQARHRLADDLADSRGYTTSLNCLTAPAHALINEIQARFGRMDIISTCRPGARVAGTGEISRHSSGNAIDFIAGDRKAAVLAWLIATHTNGGTMTYTTSPHIHVDIGPHWVILAGRHIDVSGGGSSAFASDQPVRYSHRHNRRHVYADAQPVQYVHRKHRHVVADDQQDS